MDMNKEEKLFVYKALISRINRDKKGIVKLKAKFNAQEDNTHTQKIADRIAFGEQLIRKLNYASA